MPAIDGGEVFFIAVGELESERLVLGFSSHRIDDAVHWISVYVRGQAARRGIGSALLRSAEADAIAAGATKIQIDVSFAAVEFYGANGYLAARGENGPDRHVSSTIVTMRESVAETRRR